MKKMALRYLLTLATSLAVVGCSDGGSKDDERTASSDPAGGVNEAADANAVQLAAFSTTVYPIVKEHCAECHASVVTPNFAHVDAASALRNINGSQLVSLEDPGASRIVKRLTEQAHNCWGDCAANGTEMTAAIEAWAASAGDGTPAQEFVELPSVLISSVGEVVLKGGYDKSWVRAAAYSDGYGERLAPLDDPQASQRRVMYRRADFATLPDPKPDGGAHYYFEIPASDTKSYQLCYRVKTNITVVTDGVPQNFGNRVFSTINGAARFGEVTLTNGTQPDAMAAQQIGQNYVWMPAFYARDADNNLVPTATVLKPLSGANKLDLYVYDTESAIDLIALHSGADTCSGTAVPNSGRVYGFAFDLTKVLGQQATLTIQYQKSADGLAQVFSHPTIELKNPKTKVHIEELFVTINDTLDRQLNTFASVNTDITGGGVLSTADLIVPLGAAGDKVGIHIGKISVLP